VNESAKVADRKIKLPILPVLANLGQLLKRNEYVEVRRFMCNVMDEFTHLANFDKPLDTSLVFSVQATKDGYVPRDGVCDLRDVWGDKVTVRYVDAGHVTAYTLHLADFRMAINDAIESCARKYYGATMRH